MHTPRFTSEFRMLKLAFEKQDPRSETLIEMILILCAVSVSPRSQ